MCESMVGCYKLLSDVVIRKLLFLHKILSLDINIFVTDRTVKFNLIIIGFIPDVCNILCKYGLHCLVDNALRPLLHVSVKLTEGNPQKNRSTKKLFGLLHVRICYPLTDRCPFRFAQWAIFLRMSDWSRIGFYLNSLKCENALNSNWLIARKHSF